MYSTQWCPYCISAEKLLVSKGVAINKIRIDLDETQRDIMLSKSGGKRTVPQIFIGDFHVGGFDELAALNRQGKLDSLIQS